MTKIPRITETQAQRGMYIDFEGTAIDPASFLGVLIVEDEQVDFTQYVFEPTFWAAVPKKPPTGVLGYAPTRADIQETFAALTLRAITEDRRVFAYSNHELAEISGRLKHPTTIGWWAENLVDVLPLAKAWKRCHHPSVVFPPHEFTRSRHTLERYEDLIGYSVPSAFRRGRSARRIRSVRQTLVRHDEEFSQVSGRTKMRWLNALSHNWYDCDGLRELTLAIARDRPSIAEQ